MTQPTRDVTVKNLKYRLTALPPVLGVKATTRILRLATPVFSAVAQTVKSSRAQLAPISHEGLTQEQIVAAEIAKNNAATEAQIEGGLKGLQQFVDTLDEDDLQYFSDLFLCRTKRLEDGEWKDLDPETAFSCDYGGLLLLLVEHLNMNFVSLFTDAANILKLVKG